MDRLCTRYQRSRVVLVPEILPCLLQHDWPGNVTELSSVLESSLLEAANGVIRAEDLPILPAPPPIPANSPVPFVHRVPPTDILDLDAVVQHHVRYVLDLNRGNKLKTARQLRISRSTLYRLLGSEETPAH